MALSRIWTAFIIIASLTASFQFIFKPDQQHIFSQLMTGKNTDTITAKTVDSLSLPVSVHKQLQIKTTAICRKDKVFKTSDHTCPAYRLLAAAGVCETIKEGVKLCLNKIGILALFMGFMNIAERAGGVRFLSRIIWPFRNRRVPAVPKDDA